MPVYMYVVFSYSHIFNLCVVVYLFQTKLEGGLTSGVMLEMGISSISIRSTVNDVCPLLEYLVGSSILKKVGSPYGLRPFQPNFILVFAKFCVSFSLSRFVLYCSFCSSYVAPQVHLDSTNKKPKIHYWLHFSKERNNNQNQRRKSTTGSWMQKRS